jgi:RNA polymerase sigma-70 factor (ECF subfamily)
MSHKLYIQPDEDIGLMIKARNGDHHAYDQLYHRYLPTVASFLARHNARRHNCEDLTQEVFERVWYCRGHYQPLSPVKNYLLGIAASVLREDRAKSRGLIPLDARDLENVTDASRPSPPSHAQSAEQFRAVRIAMESLPTRQRQAVELVYLAGLVPDEAAQRLGCSLQTLYSYLCLARERLREQVQSSQKK